MIRRFIVTGTVQGVGFRAALRDEARGRKLGGWVRNRRDGSVEALAQGPEQAVADLLDWARRGPPGSRVLELREISPAPEDAALLDGFEIRPGA